MLITSQSHYYSKNNSFDGRTKKYQTLSAIINPSKLNKDSFISFGWSKNIANKSPAEEILQILTDKSNKTALVISHTNADGDAYGSNIGTAGMLNNLGIKAYSVIDDQPKKLFTRMPSIFEGQTATSFIKTTAQIEGELETQGISQVDLAIITDCSVPERTILSTKNGEKILGLATKAKKIIIIDHHPDAKDQPSNEIQWKQALADKGISPENVIYWREVRASASEMIAQLDKELNDESNAGKLDKYKPGYQGYRLALASGIFSDTGAIGKFFDRVRMARISEKSYFNGDLNAGNITRQMFNWLVNTCGIAKTNINFTETTSANLPDTIRTTLEKIVDGSVQMKDINVKQPSDNDPLGYIYFESLDSLKVLAEEANKLNAEKGINDKLNKLNAQDLYKEIFEIAKRLDRNKDLGILLVANKLKPDKSGNYATSLTILSHGYDAVKGEINQEGHVFANNAAKQILEDLMAANLGKGGGHDNSKGMKSADNIDFYKDLLPVITNALKKCVITREIPDKVRFLMTLKDDSTKNTFSLAA